MRIGPDCQHLRLALFTQRLGPPPPDFLTGGWDASVLRQMAAPTGKAPQLHIKSFEHRADHDGVACLDDFKFFPTMC